jgi:biopolymer transport protein ExbB/TolQ
MKAEHRKELMTNTLANRLGDALQGMKEGPSRGTILTLAAVAVVLILILTWRYFATSAEESDSARWLRWDKLSSPEELKAFADDKEVQGHMQGRLARLEEARRNLHDGLRDIGGPGAARTQALENIKRSAELFDKLVEECSDRPLLHQQALMGAAKAHESLGEDEPAHKYYQQLSQKYASSALGKEAGEQIKRLEEARQNGDLKALREEYSKPAATAAKP